MNKLNYTLKCLLNVQILSAIIWASCILACAYFTDSKFVSTILITAAGFHVILLNFKLNKPKKVKQQNFS